MCYRKPVILMAFALNFCNKPEIFINFHPTNVFNNYKNTQKMRKLFTILLLSTFALGFHSCTKPANNNVTTYTISGVSDVTLAQGESDVVALSIQNTGTVQEQVSLDVDGLPSGVSVNFSPKSGTPSFNTKVTFSNTSAVVGSYNCRIVLRGTGSKVRYYDFTLTITNMPTCDIPGTYSYIQTCNMSGGNDTLTSFTGSNSIRFRNFGAHGWVVTANASCGNGTIEVPLQSVGNNVSVGGNGYFNQDGTITVNYTIYTVVGNTTISSDCTFNMLRFN